MAIHRPNRRYFYLRTVTLPNGDLLNKYATRPRIASDRDPVTRAINDEIAREETLKLIQKHPDLS
jgi:hypothetical protein